MRYYLILLTALTVAVVPFPTPRSLIDAPSTAPGQRATVLGYEREAFGPGWAATPEGCDTRTRLMAQAYHAESCRTPYRQWQVAAIDDPYTGKPLAPAEVEIDHIYPLSAAWDSGAHAWPAQKRASFANDPRNLVVTAASANREKSDQLPSEWLPPDLSARCAYAQRLVFIAREYALQLPGSDLRAARRACAGLSGVLGRRSL